MSVDKIKTAITELPTDDLKDLMTWITDYDATLWDRQMESDLEAGRLDTLLAEVDAECCARLAKIR